MKPVNPDGKPFPGYISTRLLPKLKSNIFIVSFLAILLVGGAVVAAAASSGPGFDTRILAAETGLPIIEQIAPGDAAPGTDVTITGSGFGVGGGEQDYVSFDAARADIASWADGEIVCAIPDGLAGEVEVTVTTVVGVSEAVAYVVSGSSPEPGPGPGPEPSTGPVIESVSPPSAWIGAEATITGSGFGTGGSEGFVTFGSEKAEIVSWSDTQIVCIIPAGIAGRVAVTVTVGGQVSGASAITIRGDGKEAPDRGNSDPTNGNSQTGWPQDTAPQNPPGQQNPNAGGNGQGNGPNK